MASLLPRAGRATNLFPDSTKPLCLGARLSSTKIRYDAQPILFVEMPLQTLAEGDYVRLLGRHALLHIFHKQDFCHLLAACRRAVAPISTECLPSHYLVYMYNAVAGGMQRWSALVRPPLPRAMRLANLPMASMLRNFGMPGHHSPELSLQPIAVGWTGLVSSVPVMIITFLSTYIRQLKHSNGQVCSTTRNGVVQARMWFHPSMSCLGADFLHV